jgi:hypothetical protein
MENKREHSEVDETTTSKTSFEKKRELMTN